MINFDLTLESDRVLLRPIKYEDLPAYARLTNDPSLWIYYIVDLSESHALETYVDDALQLMKSKQRLTFSTIDRKSGKIVGSTAFGNLSPRDKRVEIGWTWIGREYHGTGINREAKHLMLQYCFEQNDFERVELKTDVLNLPARTAMKKLGFVEEGILRSHTLMTHGRRRDTIYYSVLRNEWPDVQSKFVNLGFNV